MSFPAFQTPQRPLPGAFLQTPAASRYQGPGPVRQLFRTQSSNPAEVVAPTGQGAQPVVALPGAQAAQSQALKPVQRAARTVNEVLRKDANFPELDSYVKRKLSGNPTVEECALILLQRAYHLTMKYLLSWVPTQHGLHTRGRRCTTYQIKYLSNTIMLKFPQ